MSHLRTDDPPAPPRRLSWRRWWIGVAIVVVVGAAIGTPVVAASAWHHTDYRTVAAHRQEPLRPMSGHITPRWNRSGLPPAAGDPVAADTVVTADRHGITGRDPVTGAQRWRYRRTDTRLCSWAVQDTTVIASFADGGRCTDLDGFDAATGRELWYLNTDLPSSMRLHPGPVVFLASTRSSLTAYYLSNGNQAWTFDKPGCTLSDSASGDVGVVTIARCPGDPPSLIELDGYNGEQKWQRSLSGSNPALLSASGAVAVAAHEHSGTAVTVYTPDGLANGVLHPHGLSDAAPAPAAARQVGTRLVTYLGGRVVVFVPGTGRIDWSAPATGPALVGSNAVVVPQHGAVVEYRPDGHSSDRVTAALPDRVLGLGRVRSEVVAITADHTYVLG